MNRVAGTSILIGLLFSGALIPAAAGRSAPEDGARNEKAVELAFGAIATAWRGGDERALADMVSPAGLRITSGGNADRLTVYSASQALYYFKNLFQTRRTEDFRFQRLQDPRDGSRAHAMGVWRFRRDGSGPEQQLKLVFLLTRQDDQWRLAEVNTITSR